MSSVHHSLEVGVGWGGGEGIGFFLLPLHHYKTRQALTISHCTPERRDREREKKEQKKRKTPNWRWRNVLINLEK